MGDSTEVGRVVSETVTGELLPDRYFLTCAMPNKPPPQYLDLVVNPGAEEVASADLACGLVTVCPLRAVTKFNKRVWEPDLDGVPAQLLEGRQWWQLPALNVVTAAPLQHIDVLTTVCTQSTVRLCRDRMLPTMVHRFDLSGMQLCSLRALDGHAIFWCAGEWRQQALSQLLSGHGLGLQWGEHGAVVSVPLYASVPSLCVGRVETHDK